MQDKQRALVTARNKLKAQGKTIKAFADEKDLPYAAVRDVLAGRVHGNFGMAHQAAVALGLKEAA
jgi:gp16 family phage-associated protein